MTGKMTSPVAPNTLQKKKGLVQFFINFQKNWQLHLMMVLPLAYILIFQYAPMFGLQIAFREYRIRDGIMGSAWVGLEHFKTFFNNYLWVDYAKNTIILSLYSIFAGFPIPIILALMLHVNETKVLKKLTQNVSYIPHFISTVVLVGILNQIFNPYSGLFSSLMMLLGVDIKTNVLTDPDAFYHLYVWSGIWQSMGWSAIIYVSALSGVPMELHEAAKIDGASRWKRVLHVDLPAIMPTICIMLIMRFGAIMSVGYEKVYLLQNDLNMKKAEVISTYVYKYGLGKNDLSYGTAVGMMNSVINTITVVIVNEITDRLSDGENSLF